MIVGRSQPGWVLSLYLFVTFCICICLNSIAYRYGPLLTIRTHFPRGEVVEVVSLHVVVAHVPEHLGPLHVHAFPGFHIRQGNSQVAVGLVETVTEGRDELDLFKESPGKQIRT